MRLFLLIAGLIAATPALAQKAPPPGTPPGQPAATIIAEPVGLLIAAFDSDDDAIVTRKEFDAGLKASWKAPDGKPQPDSISYIGYSDWALRWLGNANALPNPFEIDADGDNRITFAELGARFDLFFTRFDANKDGAITRAELLTLRTPRVMTRDRKGGKERPLGE
jgi:hypothetical protein